MELDLTGMSPAAAKEYIFGFIATLKLTEKEIHSNEIEAARWKTRMDLAQSRGMDALRTEAEKEVTKVHAKLAALREEERVLKSRIDTMRRQLPGLAARERSIDADLLQQELLMALGLTEEEAETERTFQKLEKENAADEALKALKAEINCGAPKV